MQTIEGLIIKAQSGFFTVRTPHGDVVAHLRGRLKRGRRTTDLATIGDRVKVSLQPDGKGMIEAIAPRVRALTRKAPSGYGRGGIRASESDREQVIIANPDQAVFVFAAAEPDPHLRALDRYLVMAEARSLPSIIVVNKVDLTGADRVRRLFGLYPPLGYPLYPASARTGEGLAALRAALAHKISVFAGPSGVGKSSLLSAIQPGLSLRAAAVSPVTTKGRHTTVHPELHALSVGGYVADTPGMRALELFDVEPEELDGYFVDIRPLVSQCAFNNCTHFIEPGCAVRAAVEAGTLAHSRYESYVRLRRGDDRTTGGSGP